MSLVFIRHHEANNMRGRAKGLEQVDKGIGEGGAKGLEQVNKGVGEGGAKGLD